MPAVLLVHFISIRKIKRNAMMFANYEAMERVFGRKILSRNYPLLMLRVLTLILLILAVSGMVVIYEGYATSSDFVLAVDASASMLAQDYQPNRLDAAKDAALTFIDSVPANTNIGILSFAGAGFVKQSVTQDTEKLKEAVSGIDIELTGGTAIGEAVVSSVNMLVPSQKNRVVVLLTDGQNNIGVTINEALEYAESFRTSIYTIGIGTEEGGAVGNTSFVVELDTQTLKSIADRTGGQFYMAETKKELEDAYERIALGTLQEISLNLSSYLMLIALSVFLLEMILLNSKYRTIP